MPPSLISPPPPSRETVCAVVVSHHPGPGFAQRLLAAAAEAGGVVVVDNASGPGTLRLLADLEARGEARVLNNPANLGVAAALNRGVALAASEGFGWALLLDQDSEVMAGMTEAAARALTEAGPNPPAALVATNYLEKATGAPHIAPESAPGAWAEVPAAVTSGTYLSVPAWQALGPFREDYFIDLVDHEYCLRARRAGFRVILSTAPRLRHSLGRITRHRLLGRTVTTTNHAPVRRYYRARNTVALAREYGLREPRFVGRTLWLWIESVMVSALVEEGRAAKLRATARGMWHGLTGRGGEAR